MPRRTTALGFAVATAMLTLLYSATTRADAAQTAAAEALFDEARKLTMAGNYRDACPKFEESQRIEPGIGTQFNLADCYEKIGRTASAWAAFLDVSYAAKQSGQAERERVARERAQALVPRLGKLVINAPADAAAGLRITRDGLVVGAGQWATAVPVDPGNHLIEATAPKRKSWSASVQVSEGAVATLAVPQLEVMPDPPPRTLPPATIAYDRSSSSASSTQKTFAVFLGGVAVTGLTVGSIYGLMARSKNEDSMAYCSQKTLCSEQGVSLRDHARGDAAVSTVAFSVAAAAIVGGVVLWTTSGTSKSGQASARGVKAVAHPTWSGAQLGLEGSW
ncbi:MAG: hypothetical protein HY898_08225 [Deltaproteobacteria bacterium]|nr:hypothetical protein [Deltaproteobacteria bacterium]